MKKKMGAIIVGIGLVIVVGLIAMSVKVIEQGHAGVVYNRSTGVEKETLGQGWHLVSPFKRVTEYPVSTETVRVKNFNVQTKDGKPLAVSLSYDYANELEKLPKIYNKFKGQSPDVIENGWLQTRIKKATLHVFSNYSVLEVFQHQGEINAAIEKEFRGMVDDTGFMVDSVTLEAPKPDENTAKAIQGVVDAQQQLEKLEIEKKQAIVAAERDIEEAKGKAQANEVLKQSLSPEIVEIKKIEKWDGKLPQVSGGATPFVQIK
ncbi:prohibitin family protein [Bacillus sp. FSL R12-0069]|uniref:prohibitin family protein n=1 Tax=Bacillus sp. FSL R12-0069 TaxID=2975342 RepID=UPI0030F5328C